MANRCLRPHRTSSFPGLALAQRSPPGTEPAETCASKRTLVTLAWQLRACRAVPELSMAVPMYGRVGTPVSGPFPSQGPAHATRAFPRTGSRRPRFPAVYGTMQSMLRSPLHGVPSTYFFASRYHVLRLLILLPLPRRQGRATGPFVSAEGSRVPGAKARGQPVQGDPRFPSEPSRGYASSVLRPRPIRQLLGALAAPRDDCPR